MQVAADRRPLSLNDLADLLAEKVTTRIAFARRTVRAAAANAGKGEPKVVSVTDVAIVLGLNRSAVWRYIQEKRIETIHLGPRTTRIRMETINRLVKDGIS